jgi:ABC-type phosphate/phosphonate transport system substrate-binding protein
MRASLPMYDLPELRPATDAWWSGVAGALEGHGFDAAPGILARVEPIDAVWRAPDLLLSQCCGRDLVTHLSGQVVPVAIPCYRAPGCDPGSYRSWLVVRREDPRRDLADFSGATASVNYGGSHSGWVALGHALARAGLPERFFGHAVLTGGHLASLQAVAGGGADLAAIDCVTFALLEQVALALTARVRVLAPSKAAPALPYITSAQRPALERDRLYAALAQAAADPALAGARNPLLIEGFLPATGDAYARSTAMAQAAAPWLSGLAAVLELRTDAALRSSIPG